MPGTESPAAVIKNPSNIIRVLGIDPGLASTGWGIVDFCSNRYRIVKYGVIETPADSPRG